MNESFNFGRFGRFLKREFSLNFVKVLIPLAAMAFLLLLYLWFSFQHYPGAEALIAFLYMGGATIVLVLTSKIANSFQQKTTCIDYLTVPASMLEKFLTKVIRHFIVPMTFLSLLIKIGLLCYDISALSEAYFSMVGAMVAVCGIFLFWGAVFRRFAVFVGGVVVTATILLMRYLFKTILDTADLMWFDSFRIFFQNLTDTELNLLMFIGGALFFIGCAIATYFVYRRKEMKVKLFNW